MPKYKFENHLKDERFKKTVYFVEATDFEQLALWRDHHDREPETPSAACYKVPWKQDSMGFMAQIGKVGTMPVCIVFTFADIHGQTVAFYEASSQVVDHRMVEAFLAFVAPEVPKTNAMNFGHALHHCWDLRQKAA